jgi:hypothetical protein
MSRNLEELKDTVLDVVKGTLGKPLTFKNLVRAARAANEAFSYYAWDYAIVLQELEKAGLVCVNRRKERVIITEVKKVQLASK